MVSALKDIFPPAEPALPAKQEIVMTIKQARKLVEYHSKLAQVYQDMKLPQVSQNHRTEATEIGKRIKAYLGRK